MGCLSSVEEVAMPSLVKELEEDDGLVMCRLECECRARTTFGLPGDQPARSVLSTLSCPTCGRLGKMRIVQMEEPEELAPSSGCLSRPPEVARVNACDEHGPDMEGDEYLREHRSRFWRAP